jgi:hypothetical protein
MFDSGEDQTAGAGAGYGYTQPLAPGAVDPVRLEAFCAEIDIGAVVWDPVEEALFGPDPDVDVAALFAVLDGAGSDLTETADPAPRSSDVVDASVLVPEHLPNVEGMAPGPQLATLLHDADVSELGAFELVETVAGWHRLASWAAARQAAAIMELSRRAEMQPTDRRVESMSSLRVASTEVAARLAMTPREGDGLVARARVWCEDLPATWVALQAGRIDVRKAEVIVDGLRGHTLDLARTVEAEVLERAETMTAAQLRRAIIRALHRLDPDTMAQRAENAAENRFVRTSPAKDGMAWLEAYLPAADAAAIETAIQAGAAAMKRTDPDVRRTDAQRRADALAQLGWLALAAGRLGGCGCGQRLDGQHRRPVSVQVIVPISMLLGLNDQPGELAGYGPIPAQVARRLAGYGTWRRLLTDPASGAVLDYGRTRYQPPPDLVEHVAARDRTCRWPGCEKPALGCDLDHTIEYPYGPTAVGNLGPLCEQHHIGKHQSRWQVRQPEPGRFEWISPTGHTHTVEPDPLGDPDRPADPDPPADRDPPTHPDPDPPGSATPLPAADIPPF